MTGDYTVFAPGVLEKAFRDAEGKTVPLKGRPGGKVIGTATIRRDGQIDTEVTDPEANKLVDEAVKPPVTDFSIGMADPKTNTKH